MAEHKTLMGVSYRWSDLLLVLHG